VYANPSKVFDEMLDIQEIVDCAKDISEYYDASIRANSLYNLFGEGEHKVTYGKTGMTETIDVNMYDLKKKLWLALNSINVLEGVRFYVSFACSWAFAELKKMEGNAKIIKFIARDENTHLAASQTIIKSLPKDDPDFEKIAKECEPQVIKMFEDAVQQEKEWAEYLFKDGSMLGLNKEILCQYVEYITDVRVKAIGIDPIFNVTKNPIPWMKTWLASDTVQVAPQEVEISSYLVGQVDSEVNVEDLGDFEL